MDLTFDFVLNKMIYSPFRLAQHKILLPLYDLASNLIKRFHIPSEWCTESHSVTIRSQCRHSTWESQAYLLFIDKLTWFNAYYIVHTFVRTHSLTDMNLCRCTKTLESPYKLTWFNAYYIVHTFVRTHSLTDMNLCRCTKTLESPFERYLHGNIPHTYRLWTIPFVFFSLLPLPTRVVLLGPLWRRNFARSFQQVWDCFSILYSR